MKNFKQDILQALKISIVALVITLGVNYAIAWTGPTATPPNGNTPTPINVGTTNQVKDAGLSVNALSVFGTGFFSGNVGIGDTTPSNKLDINTNSITSGISFDGEVAVSSYSGNEWLRLNQNGDYTLGVYTPGVFRANTEVRSAKYCDNVGENCKTVLEMGGPSDIYETDCSSGDQIACCRINKINGSASCKISNPWPNSWANYGTPFSATTDGIYHITMTAGTYHRACRTNAITGATACKQNIGGTWTSMASPW